MAKQKKTLDDASLRAMASMASSSSDLSKLQENYGWNTEETPADETPTEPQSEVVSEKPAESVLAPVAPEAKVPIEQPSPSPVVDEEPVNNPKASPEAANSKKISKYSAAFLEPISGFERPTKVAYISKRSHSYISLLQRYANLMGSRVSMQEIMENIFREHFADNKAEIESIRTTLLQKEAELHE